MPHLEQARGRERKAKKEALEEAQACYDDAEEEALEAEAHAISESTRAIPARKPPKRSNQFVTCLQFYISSLYDWFRCLE